MEPFEKEDSLALLERVSIAGGGCGPWLGSRKLRAFKGGGAQVTRAGDAERASN